jgi:hypothetical protein
MKKTLIVDDYLSDEDKEAMTWMILEILEAQLGIETLTTYSFQLKVEYETTEGEE